ncbi:BRO family protein [Maridesulfovibrio sp.]|uniref:BRO-N domain-containing protein n=1 Tax=Maridesulfovibrio sp. TaxID=2795000 RepID=UPI002A18BD9E|nr:BRO family protein [Maridesulfovibrio sp.]
MAGKNVANSPTSDNSSVVSFVFDSNEIRTIHDLNGNTWFVAKDVATTLGYANARDAINKHCKGGSETRLPSKGGMQTVKIIPEPDLYRLIIKSKLPAAERFEKWVFEEVLPAIRQHGSYELQRQEESNIYIGKIESEHPLWYSHITIFVDSECRPDPDGVISKDEIYTHYCNFCTRNNVSPVHRARFFTSLYCLATYIRETRPRVGEKRPRLLANISVDPQASEVPKRLTPRPSPPPAKTAAPDSVQAMVPEVYGHSSPKKHIATAKELMIKHLDHMSRAERQAMLMAYDALIEAEQGLNGEVGHE